MTDTTYCVKSAPLKAFTGSFQYFADMLQTYWRCAWRSLMLKKYFLTFIGLLSYFPTTASSKLWLIVHTLWKHYLNLFSILQICYRHIEDVHEEDWCWKNIFWQTYRVFLLSHFSMTAPSNWWLIVYTLWNQLLLELSLDLFNAMKICCTHTGDVH